MAEKISIGAKEPLYKAAEKINGAIDEVNTFQTQIDQLVIEGDSSVEAAQARVDADGVAHTTLKERLDTEHNEVTAQLAQKGYDIEDIKSPLNLVPLFDSGEWDFHANVTVDSPTKVTLNADKSGQISTIRVPIPSGKYTLSFIPSVPEGSTDIRIDVYDDTSYVYSLSNVQFTHTFNITSGVIELRLKSTAIGTYSFENIMLNEGSEPLDFRPRTREALEFKVDKNNLPFSLASYFGVKGDGITDDTIALQNAINSSSKIILGEGTFLFDTLTVKNNLEIIGAGKGKTILKKMSGTNATVSSLLSGAEIDGLTIRNLTIQHHDTTDNLGNLLKLESSNIDKPIKNILIENCNFEDTLNGRTDLISVIGYAEKIRFINSDFYGYSNVNTTYSSGLIKFDNNGLFNDPELSPVWIDNCHFEGCKEGVTFLGAGSPPSPLFITDNFFTGQARKGLQIYHGERYYISGNRFENITAASGSNNDSGVVWLDQVNTADDERTMFVNNIIHDCYGNGIFLEEFSGVIRGNEIRLMKERINDTYTVTYPYDTIQTPISSLGGIGILITGGCNNLVIQGNRITGCEKTAIMANRALGVQLGYDIDLVHITDNFLEIDRHTIMIRERVLRIFIKNNTIKSSTTNTSAWGIHVDRENTHDNNRLQTAFIEGNHFRGHNGVMKAYVGSKVVMSRNDLYLSGSVSSINVADLITKGNYKFDLTTSAFLSEV